jgi:hypothetical protein
MRERIKERERGTGRDGKREEERGGEGYIHRDSDKGGNLNTQTNM